MATMQVDPEVWKDIFLDARRLGWHELRGLPLARGSLHLNDLLDIAPIPDWDSTHPSSPNLSPVDSWTS